MGFLLGDIVFNFDIVINEGDINFYEWIGDNWVIFFFYLADYILVCMIELGYIVKLKDEFVKCNVKVIVLFVDSVEDYNGWIKDIEEMQNVFMNFLIIVDVDCMVVGLYQMIYLNVDLKVIVCLVYVIDLNKKICVIFIYLLSVGCNFDEVLCLFDSFQLIDEYKVVMLVNWIDGDDVIVVLLIFDVEVDMFFLAGYNKIKLYLWVMKQFNKVFELVE